MKRTRTALTICTILALGAGLSACSTSVEPDKVGLYYMKGSSDGYKFGHCMEPGAAEDYKWDNEVVFLPANTRTWVISDDDPNADSKTPITVSGKPIAGQTSGTQVNVWGQINFTLDTTCNTDKGGTLRDFWEDLGRRYGANTDDGWKNMLRATIESALKAAIRTNAGEYTADDLVNVSTDVRAGLQAKIAAAFSTNLKRMTGKDYFCGPTFKRGTKNNNFVAECPPVEVIITSVEYTDPGIQEARSAKQKAVEQAAAAVAAADGQVQAAKKLESLYQNQAWMALEKAKLELAKAEACAKAPNCTIILGDPDKIQVGK